MDGRRLVGEVRMAHADLEADLAAVANAGPESRPVALGRLIRRVRVTSEAEETVLFPALQGALGEEPLLAETCRADHRDVMDRLQTLARRPGGPGFERALGTLADDMRDHQRDEIDTLLPVICEALGEQGSAELAEVFSRAMSAGEPTG